MSLEGKSAEEVAALAELSASVLNNPKTRGHFQRILKAANPEISIPEIEVEERIFSTVQPYAKKIEEMQAEREQEKAIQAANNLYESLRDNGVVSTRSDFNGLVQYASENGFMTDEKGLKKAASSRTAEQQAAEPTPSVVGFPKPDRDNKDLMRDPRGWAHREAMAAINELNQKKRFV